MGLLRKIGRSIGKALGSIGKAIGKAAGAIFGGIGKMFQPFGFSPEVPDYGFDESQQTQEDAIQGVLVNKDSAIAQIPVVYGTRMVGGIRVFVSTNGSTNGKW